MLKYNEDVHKKAKTVVDEIEEYEGGAEDLTMNEMAIINHYENHLKDRPTADIESIKGIAYNISDFTYQLEFIRNYFDLISVIHKKRHDHDSLIGLHISLFNDGGLQNFDQMLKNGSELLNKNRDDLLTAVEEE